MTRVRRTVLTLGAATLFLGAAPGGGSGPATGDCILGCYQDFEEFEHTAPQAGDFALYEDGWHDNPVEGLCNCGIEGIPPKHSFCNPPVLGCGSEEEDLQAAVIAGDAAGIERRVHRPVANLFLVHACPRLDVWPGSANRFFS